MTHALRAAVAAMLLAALTACTGSSGWHTDEGAAWGTLYHITYRAPRELHDSVRATMRAVELSVSPFEPASRICAVNAGRTDTLDATLAQLVEASQQVWRLSGGAFDPTVLPVVDLWGFGPAGRTAEPTQQQIDSALATVGIDRCRLLPGRRLVRPSEGTRLDFSAIAKGMGVDAVAAMLRRNGATDYMVEIGGEVALGGQSPRGGMWRIQIDAPMADDPTGAAHERLRVVSLPGGACVATSGNYRNYRVRADGTRAGHIISPRTGRPAEAEALAATVVAPSCMTADALATAAMAMHPDSAMRMAAALPHTHLLLVLPAGTDTFRTVQSPGFPR